MIWSSPLRFHEILGFLLVLAPSVALAQTPDIHVTATADKKTIELSQSLTVTLTIEGPAPLRIELPKQLLVPESERDWKIQMTGPATVMPLAGNRERWNQVYRLDPFAVGTSMSVVFAPLRVNGRDVAGAGFEVTVQNPQIELKAGNSMPVTGIEQLPPESPSGSSASWWWLILLVPVVAAAIVAWRFHRPSRPLPPREWAESAFVKLERENVGGPALVTAVAAIVRGFIERQSGLPAPKLTTEELLAATEQAAWPLEQADSLRLLLEECDRAKFAGDVPDADGCRRLLERGREWVNLISPGPQPE